MQTGQVFISHTSDMARFPAGRSFVRAALDAVGRAGLAPVDMRYFSAREDRPADYCRQRVTECEVYVGVVGFRYGSLVPGERVSYTELEFDAAGLAGLPRLVFLLAGPDGLPRSLADPDQRAVQEFRQRLREAGLIVAEFASDAGLELEVFHALTELVASGRLAGAGAAPRGAAVRYSLPPATAAFTGRGAELDAITGAAAGAAAGGALVAIRAIGGMPGIGKTVLAVHAAHLLTGRFPDRQLFIDLHGHTPGQDPLPPADALAVLLSATGADPRSLPGDLAGRAALWQDRMAGQRALLVLDNAASSEQVAPLLPGGAGCLVLVTSRRHLGDLPGDVIPVPLGTLEPGQAREMFLRLAPRAATAPERTVAELTELAGFLPLAISLLARLFARHPSWTLADLAAETRQSLLTLSAEQHSVAAAFEMSYRHLPPGRQEFFAALGLHPGTTTDAQAAAALAGIPLEEAATHLDALHGEGLLTETAYRRYGMHDLIHSYARDLAAAGPDARRDQALGRLLDYYSRAAARAEALLARRARPSPLPAVPAGLPGAPDLNDESQALAWARAERANLLACLDHAAATGQDAQVIALTAGLAGLLRHDGPWADAINRHAAATRAAQRLDDRPGQAGALINLGELRRLTGDYPAAAQDLEQALAIYRDLGDRHGQANALSSLGTARRGTGDYPAAVQDLEQALAIYRDLGDRHGQANALSSLGVARWQATDFPAAVQDLEQALAIYRDLGDRHGQGIALGGLGVVRRLTGDYPAAVQDLEQALAIYRDLGDRHGQAIALGGLGNVRRLTGDYPAAAQSTEQALSICRDLGDLNGQANSLGNLGVVRRLTSDYPAAAQATEQALAIFRDLGDRGGETEVLNERGTLYRVSGELARAEECHHRALEIARAIVSSWDEAHALAGLGRCALAADHAKAEILLRQALEIFQRIGAAEAPGLAAELAALTSPPPAQKSPA
jgi:tetratricopeptide (TPR) repeat protein